MAALQGRRILLHLRPLPLLAQQGFRRAIAPPIPHCRFLSPSFPPAAAASPSLPTSAVAVVQAARGAGSVVLEQRGGTSGWPPSSLSALLLHAAAPWAHWTTMSPADHMVLMLLGANASVFMLWRVLAYPSFIADPYMVSLDMYFGGRLHTLLMSTSSLVDPAFMARHFMVANEFGPAFLLELYVAGALSGALFYLAEMSFLAPRKMGPGGWLTPCLVSTVKKIFRFSDLSLLMG